MSYRKSVSCAWGNGEGLRWSFTTRYLEIAIFLYPKYFIRILMLSASRSLRSARSLICRTRSLVRFRLLATSSAVISLRPMPKSIFSTWRSRSESVPNADSRSDDKDSFSIRLSVPGALSSVMMSIRLLESSSWNGASTDTFFPAPLHGVLSLRKGDCSLRILTLYLYFKTIIACTLLPSLLQIETICSPSLKVYLHLTTSPNFTSFLY